MVINSLMLRLLASVFLCLLATNVNAHDPGFSLLEVSLLEKKSVVKLSMANEDFAALYSVDTGLDGELIERKPSNSQATLADLARNSIELWSENTQLLPHEVNVQRAETDVMRVMLTFDRLEGVSFTLKSPSLLQLPRGHRQYINVVDAADETIVEHIFSSTVNEQKIDLQKPGVATIFVNFLKEGVRHIWIGFDHILFLVTLILPAVLLYQSGQWHPARSLYSPLIGTLKIVTAFTVAHSITLSLAALQILTPPSQWVESAIAVTVILVALNNLRPLFLNSHWVLAFIFGLIHGFGFAGVLLDLGLPQKQLGTSLLAFNLGVEIGQVVIVGLLFPLIYMIRFSPFYHRYLLKGGSFVVIIIGVYWLWERTLVMQSIVI